MSALSDLNVKLKQFWDLPHHDNPQLAAKLAEVQNWQKDRIRKTHADLFSQPKTNRWQTIF